ncbi:MAG: DUF3164 family protein, partial [Pseudomonadota bacterium]
MEILKKLLKSTKGAAPAGDSRTGHDRAFLFDDKGRQVKRDSVSSVELKRDEMCLEVARRAQNLRALMVEEKQAMYAAIEGYFEFLRESKGQQGITPKGNATIFSYDKAVRLEIDRYTHYKFNEVKGLAVEKIELCVER